MKGIFDLSLRYKIPLWGSALIVVSAAFVAGSLMFRAYTDLKQDLFISADALGRSLARTLFQPLLHDNVWQAFEIVRAPFHGDASRNPVQVDMVLVLDRMRRVYVSTQPKRFPVLSEVKFVSGEFGHLADEIAGRAAADLATFEVAGADHFYFVTPVADRETVLGHLVLVYSKAAFQRRFAAIASHAGGIALLALAVLLPINWYWARRTADPLVLLADRMGEVGQRVPQPLDPELYPYRDELGRLFEAYGRMVKELNEKAVLSDEMVRSERLAAVGRLSAGIAHEINNPLAGLLTVTSTLRHHRGDEARTAKAIELIERGLTQIRDTVAALLVESRVKSRDLCAQDVEDVRTLLGPQAHRRFIELDWHSAIETPLPLPANLTRQIMINLLLNAIQAADAHGKVGVRIATQGDSLRLAVSNDGRCLTPEQKEHLFEPFVSSEGTGHGLGLWVTYQIVSQLAGRIEAESEEGRTTFSVELPLGQAA